MTIYDRLKHGVDVTKFKADQAMRIRDVQSEIDSVRREIAAFRDQLATATLKLHKEGAINDEKLLGLCLKIDQLNEQIELKENLIASIRAELPPQVPQTLSQQAPGIPCPNCHANVQIGSQFCTNCGNSMPEPSVAAPNSATGSKVFCTNCGNQMPEGAEFCTNCGQKTARVNTISKEEDKNELS